MAKKKYPKAENKIPIINDKAEAYGSKGQNWSDEFVKYMKAMATHPAYANMPDAVKEDGKIQWEAPSNRSGGKYQYTHQKRKSWWEAKAKEAGIDTTKDKWISRTAKTIHPTGEKPCKKCGLVLRIGYVYPGKRLISSLKKHFGDDFEVTLVEPINEIIQKAVDLFGTDSINKFSQILKTGSIDVPEFGDEVEELLSWIEDEYIPKEPSTLSPGAMSNAPDRFDGFHSFNRCCRGTADKGRHASNLKAYTTDRRVFEYWSEGDWVAADRLMGLVRTKLSKEPNADGGEGSPTADHIGPLSLGFCHRPEFRLLSKEANSAKNNRMTFQDVQDLISAENKGLQVVSWYAKGLWDERKKDVDNEEKALRLSKMLRDNQRNAMMLLSQLFSKDSFLLLIYFLELKYAEYKVTFENLGTQNFITTYDSIKKVDRTTKYAVEQKARRIRIGMEALRSFQERENRHMFLIDKSSMEKTIESVHDKITKEAPEIIKLDNEVKSVLLPNSGVISETKLRTLVEKIETEKNEIFEECKEILTSEMDAIGKHISTLWNDDRYVRENFTF